MHQDTAATTPRTLILLDEPDAGTVVLGITMLERQIRALRDAGVRDVTVVAPAGSRQEDTLPAAGRARDTTATWVTTAAGRLDVAALRHAVPQIDAGRGDARLLVLLGGVFIHPRLVTQLLASAGPAALADSSPPPRLLPALSRLPRSQGLRLAGAALVTGRFLQAASGDWRDVLAEGVEAGTLQVIDAASERFYSRELRRVVRPCFFGPPPPDAVPAARRHVVAETQKNAIDLPGWLHAPVENRVVALIADTPITPNHVTAVVNVLGWATVGLVGSGHLGAGVTAAAVASVLDGVDGKLARARLAVSKAGSLEHHFDLVFEIAMGLALGYHFTVSGRVPEAPMIIVATTLFEMLAGLAKIPFLKRFGFYIDETSQFDRGVRLLATRRNVYVWIMVVGCLIGQPEAAFRLWPWWAGATAVVQAARAAWLHRFGRPETFLPNRRPAAAAALSPASAGDYQLEGTRSPD